MRALLILALAAPLAAAQPAGGLVGTWQRTGSVAATPVATGGYIPDVPEAPFRLAFDGGGGLSVETGMDLAYTFDGQTLAIRVLLDGAYEPIAASIDANRLTITDPDDGTPLVFVRDGSAGADGIVGRWMRPAASAGESNAASAGFEFAVDGTSRTLYVATVPYIAERGVLVTGDPLAMVANVRVTGDRMRLVQKGRVSTYVRATGGAVDAPVVALQRTACYGRCPEYTLMAYADGRVVWTGRRNVATVGTAERQVSPALVAELVAMAGAAGHAGFPERLGGPDVCEQIATDLPGAITTVTTAGTTHTVTRNGGCRGFRGEAALRGLETAIDHALGTSAWGGAPTSGAPR